MSSIASVLLAVCGLPQAAPKRCPTVKCGDVRCRSPPTVLSESCCRLGVVNRCSSCCLWFTTGSTKENIHPQMRDCLMSRPLHSSSTLRSRLFLSFLAVAISLSPWSLFTVCGLLQVAHTYQRMWRRLMSTHCPLF